MGPRPPLYCPRYVPGQLREGCNIQRIPLLNGITKGTHVGPGTALGASHVSQQACINSIVQFGKWGSERLRNSPEITQPRNGRAQTGTQICLMPKPICLTALLPCLLLGFSFSPRMLPGGASLGREHLP